MDTSQRVKALEATERTTHLITKEASINEAAVASSTKYLKLVKDQTDHQRGPPSVHVAIGFLGALDGHPTLTA